MKGTIKQLELWGLLLGFIGVLGFSQTLPVTRLVVEQIDPMLVGLGRVILAAIPAMLILILAPKIRISSAQWFELGLVTLGVVIGFPLFSALAMEELPASHGAVVIGLLPLMTVVMARLRSHERPSGGFWWTAIFGSTLVVVYGMREGGGQLLSGDLWLFAAILIGALGYQAGGSLAAALGGWRVICWGLVLGAPFALLILLIFSVPLPTDVSFSTWVGLGYLTLISQLLGFFAWYQGMAWAGVTRTSQLQLLMPFLALIGAGVLQNESITLVQIAFAAAMMGIVVLNRKMPVESHSIYQKAGAV